MNFIIWLIFGGIVGWIASIIMNTNAQQGILLNIVIGIIGAFLGGWLSGFIGNNNAVTGLNIESFVVALIGAILLIALARVVGIL